MKRGTFLDWRRLLLGLTVLFVVLSCCTGLHVSIPQKEYEVARGGETAMSCSYTPARPEANAFLVKWEVQPDLDNDPWRPVATWFPDGQTDIAPPFEGRAQLSVDISTQQSVLKIDKVLMQDSRTFQCSVTIPGDDEGITAATTSLLVLVAPSQPVCGIQGDAEYWNNISLSCFSEEGSPSPAYGWQSFSVLNAPRKLSPKTTDKDGILALYNISKEDSGFFVCTSKNRVGSANCNLTLAVLPVSMKVGSTAGIVGGVVAGMLILGLVIYCCCCKKDKQNKYTEDAPEAVEFQDQPSVRDQYWDDKSSTLTKPYVEESDTFEERSVRDHGNHDNNRVGMPMLKAEKRSYNEDKDYGNSTDGIRGRLDDKRDFSHGSRDRLDDQDRIRGSRDRLDDQSDRYRGSRDRLDDQRDRYRGSRDRLDNEPDVVRGSLDRLEDKRDRSRGSRDRLDDHHHDIRGSRDGLDNTRGRYGSRDGLDDNPDRRYGSRDGLDDNPDRRYGSRDGLDDNPDRRYGSRDNLDARYNQQGGSRDRLDERSYDL